MRFSFEGVLAAVSDESFRFFDTAHDIVASVDALGAMDAFHLQSVADIDTGGAYGGTVSAIDAVPLGCCGAFAFVSWFTSVNVVGNDEAFAIEHDGLEATVRASDHAELFSEEHEVVH